MDMHRLAAIVVLASYLGVFLLVAGVLFGPWTIDPQATVLIALVG